MFILHPRLAADTVAVAALPLCEVRLMNDSRFPWLILVPRRADVREVHALDGADQAALIAESSRAALLLERLFAPDKINLGALGNLVPQLHWHVVARFRADAAWPGPIWGSGTPQPYTEAELAAAVERLSAAIRQ